MNEREQLQRALAKAEAARDEAEAANNAKDAFLAMVSHELRGPLTAILGWTNVLRSGQADLAHGLDVIERNARIQRSLIDELMDVSRVTTGEMTITRAPVALDQLVRQVIDAAQPAAGGMRLDLAVSIQDPPIVIVGDALRLHQIVSNILANAMKYTPEGGAITVTVTADDGDAELTVADTGVGIEPALLEHIFEPFWQARRASNAYRGGLGLGLPIVRRLVHLHGGSIRAISEGPGHGTRIIVRFALAGGGQRRIPDRRHTARRAEV